MAARKDISAEYARQLLEYDSVTGLLTWKARTQDMFKNGKISASIICKRWNTRYAGKIAGTPDKYGYTIITVNYTRFLSHRLGWLITYGEWPKGEIDHINGIEKGDGIENLRCATRRENMQNIKIKKINKSGWTGSSFHKGTGKWIARIRANGKSLYIGLFATAKEAGEAYAEEKRKLHDFQPNQRR